MARLLYRLGSTAYRRWPFFLIGWVLVIATVGGTAALFSKPMSDEFTIPGIPSEEAADLQQELFPQAGDAFDDATVSVVVAAPEGTELSDPENQERIAELIKDINGLPQMADDPAANPGLGDPVERAEAQREAIVGPARQGGGDVAQAKEDAAAVSPVADNGRVGIMQFEWDVDTVADVKPASHDALKEVLEDNTGDGFVAEANGPGLTAVSPPGGQAELIGVGLALVILLITFGSLVAGGMPIFNALIGVGIGTAGVTAMTAFMTIGTSTPMLATMIGLAVGIDYTLFILARYRTELRATDDRAHAAGVAVGTAGSAVVFAGLTVLIALSGMAVVGIPFLTAMGLAAAATVLIAVLVALTLLPALLGVLKSGAFKGRVRKYEPEYDEQGLILNNGVRWARILRKAPVAFVLVVVVGLGALALPLQNLQLAFPTDSTAPTDTTQRKASDLISEAFGPGREAPMLVVVDGRDIDDADERQGAFNEVVQWAAQQEGVANAQLVATNAPVDEQGKPTGPATGAIVNITPDAGPASAATLDLLQELRDGEPAIEEATGVDTGVTGLTAITTDVSDRLNDALAPYLAVVIGLAFLLLILVFRSILVPLTATLGFLLSVLATLGATVAIFQEGMFGIFEGQPIVSFMPIFVIGVVFGLAMDYQVFLVTRMREAHVHGMSTGDAVVDGFRNSARVVTAAAAIMTAVFSGFVFEDDAIIKSMGFALALSIIFDAFIVRMVLIPSILYLLGEKAWWMPKWLDRILPVVDVEGEQLDRTVPGKHAARETERELDTAGV